jgi:hypothetical protein
MLVTINPVRMKAVALRAAAVKATAIKAAGIKVTGIKAACIKAAGMAGALQALPGQGAVTPGRALGVAALITWVLDAGSGGYMIGTWIRRGGPRARLAAGDRLAPALVFGHFGLASTGLLLWASYVLTLAPALAWVAVTLLILVIGLGISTVTLWTPFPALPATADDPKARDVSGSSGGQTTPDNGPPAGSVGNSLTGGPTDEELERALTDEALLNRLVDDVVASVPADSSAVSGRRRQRHRGQRQVQMMALIPAGHGLAAMATVLLAVLAAATTAR